MNIPYEIIGTLLLLSVAAAFTYYTVNFVRRIQETTNQLVLESEMDSNPTIFLPTKTKRKGFTVNKAQERQRVAAAKRIFKCSSDLNKKYKIDAPVGAWYEDKNKYSALQLIANNYCGVLLVNGFFVSGVPEINADQKPVDIHKYLTAAIGENKLEITEFIPDLKTLRSYEKDVRSKNEYYKQKGIQGAPIFIKDELVNTKYLIDVLALLPNAKVFVNDTKMCRPILVMSPCGFGLVLPIQPLGAVDGEKEFRKNYPGVNSPKNPVNVFLNKNHERVIP